MLLKLMKHEMKSLWHYCGVVIICVLIASVVFELGVVGTVVANNDVLNLIMIPSLIFLGFAIVAVLSYGIQFGVAFRFYRTMSSDEGYLTHTLPVTTSQHILSKLFSASIYVLIGIIYLAIFIAVTALILMGLTGGIQELTDFLRDLGVFVDEIRKYINIPIALYIIEFIIMGIFSMVFSILVMYLSVALGQLVNSHKLIMSIVFYTIITSVIGIITQIGTMIFSMVEGFMSTIASTNSEAMTPERIMAGMQTIMLVTLVVMIGFGLGAFFITKYIYERKLNLE